MQNLLPGFAARSSRGDKLFLHVPEWPLEWLVFDALPGRVLSPPSGNRGGGAPHAQR
jgi:hypothetical protein